MWGPPAALLQSQVAPALFRALGMMRGGPRPASQPRERRVFGAPFPHWAWVTTGPGIRESQLSLGESTWGLVASLRSGPGGWRVSV